jgi:hypothetical protein
LISTPICVVEMKYEDTGREIPEELTKATVVSASKPAPEIVSNAGAPIPWRDGVTEFARTDDTLARNVQATLAALSTSPYSMT